MFFIAWKIFTIQRFELFFFFGHFWLLFKIFYSKRMILCVDEMKCSLLYLDIWIARKIDWCVILRGIYSEEYSWRLIRLIHMLYWHYSFVYAEREISKTNGLDLSFLFIFLSRWINSNKFKLIHLHQKLKSILTLNINVRLKVTRVFCILNSNGIE